MYLKTPKTLIAAGVAATLGLAPSAYAETEMVVVSWGGAYSARQQGA